MRLHHLAILIAAALFAVACGSSASSEPTDQQERQLKPGNPCTVTGDPPVTNGCDEGEVCALEACTATIPPSCVGHCEVPAGPPDGGKGK